MSPPDILDSIIKLELDKLNENLPQKRIIVEELLKKEPFSIPTKKNEELVISKNELLSFLEFFDESLYKDIRVPILILSSRDIYKVGGGKIDQWVIERLLGYINESIVFIKYYESMHDYYYSYQIQRLKKKYPNIIQIIYSL